jgi:hypothetical protein
MRAVTPMLMLILLTVGAALPAIEPTTAAEAEALVSQGMVAMRDANAEPKRIVDAAIAFGAALAYYDKVKNIDKVCDLQANIFWCKKRMSLDSLTDYVAQKHQDASLQAALATVDQVAATTVPASEAQAYFDRAQAFADRHPDEPMQIAIHFFEVAERFQGSELSIKSQRLSLDAQQRYAQSAGEATARQRETLFTRTAVVAGKQDAPGPEALKSAVASVRDLLKEDYARTRPKQRQALIAKLLAQGQETADNADLRCALFSEARDQAIAQHDPAHALIAVDALAAAFKGIDAPAAKKAALSRMPLAVVPALIKLLETPDDGDANTSAGRYFAFEAADWKSGLPLLTRGSDKVLAKLAEMELASPTVAGQQSELADLWYDSGKKNNTTARMEMLARACYWYELAEPAIKGMTHAVAEKRLEELHNLLPLPANFNYEHITAAQWERLKAPLFEVQATRVRTDCSFRVVPGVTYRVVPHPTDTWSNASNVPRMNFSCTAAGDAATPRRWGALLVGVGSGPGGKPGLLTGDGDLVFYSDMPRGRLYAPSGSIRVKVITIEDE